MNEYCNCNYCNHGDMPIDDEMTLEMRIDIAEAHSRASANTYGN